MNPEIIIDTENYKDYVIEKEDLEKELTEDTVDYTYLKNAMEEYDDKYRTTENN